MDQRKSISKEDLRMLWSFLLFTFAIAWGTEFLLIAMYHFNLLSKTAATVPHFGMIGFGAGMAPAYAAFIVRKKQSGIKFKEFCKQIFYTEDPGKSVSILIVCALIQFASCAAQEDYLGNPWYLFIVFMPMMFFGGGLEEIGWRGVLQPFLEKRFSLFPAALIQGAIWSVWHLPLWLVPNTSQGNYGLYRLCSVLHDIGAAADKKHLGNDPAPCVGKCFRGDVHNDRSYSFPKCENFYRVWGTDRGNYADTAFSEET